VASGKGHAGHAEQPANLSLKTINIKPPKSIQQHSATAIHPSIISQCCCCTSDVAVAVVVAAPHVAAASAAATSSAKVLRSMLFRPL